MKNIKRKCLKIKRQHYENQKIYIIVMKILKIKKSFTIIFDDIPVWTCLQWDQAQEKLNINTTDGANEFFYFSLNGRTSRLTNYECKYWHQYIKIGNLPELLLIWFITNLEHFFWNFFVFDVFFICNWKLWF